MENSDKVRQIFMQHPGQALTAGEINKLDKFVGTGAWGGLTKLYENGLVQRVSGRGTREDPYRYEWISKPNGQHTAMLEPVPAPVVKAAPKTDAHRAIKWVLEGVDMGVIAPEDALKRIRQIVG